MANKKHIATIKVWRQRMWERESLRHKTIITAIQVNAENLYRYRCSRQKDVRKKIIRCNIIITTTLVYAENISSANVLPSNVIGDFNIFANKII